jgi:hypothetical protein
MSLVFSNLINYAISEDLIITEDLLKIAENKLASQRRKSLTKEKNPDCKLPNKDILEKYVTAEDIVRNIPSIVGLAKKNESRRNGEIQPKKEEIKFDDVRNMSLGLDNLEGYTEAEKSFVQQRLSVYERDYNLEKAADKFKALRAVICEMKILQLETLLASKPKGDPEIQNQINALDKQHAFHCDGLNALKKQMDNQKNKPQDKMDLTGNINKLDKSLKELQQDVDKSRKEEQKMIEKLNNKKR